MFAYTDTQTIARRALGVSGDQAWELFNGSAVKAPPQTLKHAREGVKHIRAFQKKYAAQLKAKRV